MPDEQRNLRVAIVGLGPRGLGAIEALILSLKESTSSIHIDVFDSVKWAGAGPNFCPEQTSHCLLNIPTREVDIAPNTSLELCIGNFEEWLDDPAMRDRFPTRAKLGQYLAERFAEVANFRFEGVVINRNVCRIVDLDHSEEGAVLRSKTESFGPYDEVLLTLGQPETKPDEQISRWQSHAADCGAEVHSAYPDRKLLESAKSWTGQTIAIRGLGLSTFDVLRILTVGLGGTFENGCYIRSGQEPDRILPFSLDGQPPVPKPLTKEFDLQFELTMAEADKFASALDSAMTLAASDALDLITSALVEPATRILRASGDQANPEDVNDWLATELQNPGTQEIRPPLEALRANIAVASCVAAPDTGYVVGQIWRKLQNALRAGFNPTAIDRDTAAAIISFDEGLKRYSYGPPLRSAQELLMLAEAGLVDLIVADDPDIELVDGGWKFIEGRSDITSSVIVDAVIPPATLESLTEPLFLRLKEKGLVSSFGDNLGLRTESDGRLVGVQRASHLNLSLLGRLAIGSVIAVDSIHDCFGASATRWAISVGAAQRDDGQAADHSCPAERSS